MYRPATLRLPGFTWWVPVCVFLVFLQRDRGRGIAVSIGLMLQARFARAELEDVCTHTCTHARTCLCLRTGETVIRATAAGVNRHGKACKISRPCAGGCRDETWADLVHPSSSGHKIMADLAVYLMQEVALDLLLDPPQADGEGGPPDDDLDLPPPIHTGTLPGALGVFYMHLHAPCMHSVLPLRRLAIAAAVHTPHYMPTECGCLNAAAASPAGFAQLPSRQPSSHLGLLCAGGPIQAPGSVS